MLTHSLTHSLRKFSRFSLVIFSLLLNTLYLISPSPVYAASSPWSQTDWSGGSGQTSWSDATKYSSASSIDTSTTAGQATLTNTEQFSNTGFESNLTGWTPSANSLGTSLNAFWKLDEASGTRSDSVGSNNLTDNNTVTQATGKIGNAAQFTRANSEQLTLTDNTSISCGDIDFTFSAWVYFNSLANYESILGKSTHNIQANVEYSLYLNADASRNIEFNVSDGVNATGNAETTTTLTTGTWYFVVAWHDSVANTVNIQLDNGTVISTPYSAGCQDGTQTFRIGNIPSLGFMNGSIDAVGFWKKVLSAAEITALYNSGTGGEYPFYTNTRDTSTTYSSSSGSSKIVAVDATNFTQSVNVGNTNTYNLSAYAYTNGSAITSSDVQLYANGSTVSTTYTSAGSGWYKLTGTITGTASSVGYGVQVKAAKTVYLDNMSLNSYASSGTLTSSIFDTELTGATAWGNLTYSATTPTNSAVSVKIKTSNSSSMSGATDFSSCDAITSGTDISTNNCVTDGHRYIQYQLTLSNSSTEVTPTFQDVSIAFSSSDSSAPSISLTALSPDPNTDTTPTLSGTATEESGTVSNIQFQMDSTSGSWSSCTATDGSFNSASEAFSCTASTLTDGSHTMYVRATDSNGNTTSSSYASDTFTIDATNPVSIDLDSPGDNSYTNSERPTFKWKATTDATAGLSKYVLEIDNPSLGSGQASGDFTIDSIPTSRTTDYETNKYLIHYENFSDSDSTNNYISVYTKSHSDWGSSENDGKLREGRVSWKVKAVDNASNETSSSRVLFVDRTNPNVEFTQINEIATSPSAPRNDGVSTTDKTPTIFGKITDPLAGGDSSQTQTESGPRVASAPKEVNIKVEKKEGLTYKLVTLYKINMDSPYYTCDTGKTIDNSKQKCDKYLPFEYTPEENLDFGTYKITLSGKDKADNSSGESTFALYITTLSKITTPEEKKIIEEETRELKPEDKEQIEEELEITKPAEEISPSALEKAGENITQSTSVITNAVKQSLTDTMNRIASSVNFLAMTLGKVTAFVGNGIGSGLANASQAIGNGYNSLTNNAPGAVKTILTGIGNRVQNTTAFIGNTTQTLTSATGFAIQKTGKIASNAAQTIASARQNTVNSAKEGISDVAFKVGEKTQDFSDTAGFAIVKLGYLFVNEPTKIANVQVSTLSPASVTVSWVTNHPANGKVNYGLDRTYPFGVQSEKRVTRHEFTLTNLQPDTLYYFEVMSYNKNYVYDANREFRTPK